MEKAEKGALWLFKRIFNLCERNNMYLDAIMGGCTNMLVVAAKGQGLDRDQLDDYIDIAWRHMQDVDLAEEGEEEER